MDFITPFIKIAYAFIKKYWKYVVMLLLAGLVVVVFLMFRAERKAHMETELDRQRNLENVLNLEKEVSRYAQVVEMSRDEIKRSERVYMELDSVSKQLDIAQKDIRRLHLIKSSTSTVTKTVIERDTVFSEGFEPQTFNSIAIKGGCLTGRAYWMEGQDTAEVETKVITDLTVADYVTKSKGYALRDTKRFFTGRWRLIGSDKWEAKVIVVNNCSPGQIYEKNILIKQTKKGGKK